MDNLLEKIFEKMQKKRLPVTRINIPYKYKAKLLANNRFAQSRHVSSAPVYEFCGVPLFFGYYDNIEIIRCDAPTCGRAECNRCEKYTLKDIVEIESD